MGDKKPVSDKSIINACILRSQYILYAQSAQHSRKETDLFINRLPPNAPLTSKDSLKELDNELFILIDGMKRDIARYLKPIFHEQDIGIGEKFWFSSQELADGYVLLSSRQMEKFDIHDRALLLSNVKHEDVTYSAGTIVPWMKFSKMVESVTGVIDGQTFILHYAMRKLRKNGKNT